MARTDFNNYRNYIEPNYKFGPGYREPAEIGDEFNSFSNSIIDKDFGEAIKTHANPKNSYNFSSHMGQAMRYIDAAKDEYIKAVFAFYAEKDVASPATDSTVVGRGGGVIDSNSSSKNE